jgi:hypothetical protein
MTQIIVECYFGVVLSSLFGFCGERKGRQSEKEGSKFEGEVEWFSGVRDQQFQQDSVITVAVK